MTTLITGGGLVGARAAEQVLERGDEVVLFDVAPNLALLGPAAEKITIVRGDLLLLPEFLAAVRQHRPERILHTAGLLTPAGQERPSRHPSATSPADVPAGWSDPRERPEGASCAPTRARTWDLRIKVARSIAHTADVRQPCDPVAAPNHVLLVGR